MRDFLNQVAIERIGQMISFVILTWNSETTIDIAIQSVLKILAENRITDFEILVVDNGSTDATLQKLDLYRDKSSLKIIELETNQGTTVSRNLALKQANGEFICIMDSDVVIENWDIRESLDFIKKHLCMLAPRLVYPDGRIQNSIKKFPTLTSKLLKLPKILFGVEKYAYLDFYSDISNKGTVQADTAISAFWLFPASFLKDVGYLDEKIFYSPEDVDYCVRIQQAGYPIYYYPEIKAIHHTQQISHRKPFGKMSLKHFGGLLYYFGKHKYVFSAKRLRGQIKLTERHY